MVAAKQAMTCGEQAEIFDPVRPLWKDAEYFDLYRYPGQDERVA
jgi:hypothetical protein